MEEKKYQVYSDNYPTFISGIQGVKYYHDLYVNLYNSYITLGTDNLSDSEKQNFEACKKKIEQTEEYVAILEKANSLNKPVKVEI